MQQALHEVQTSRKMDFRFHWSLARAGAVIKLGGGLKIRKLTDIKTLTRIPLVIYCAHSEVVAASLGFNVQHPLANRAKSAE